MVLTKICIVTTFFLSTKVRGVSAKTEVLNFQAPTRFNKQLSMNVQKKKY